MQTCILASCIFPVSLYICIAYVLDSVWDGLNTDKHVLAMERDGIWERKIVDYLTRFFFSVMRA